MNKEKVKEVSLKGLKDLGIEVAILVGKKLISVAQSLQEVKQPSKD